MFRLFLICFFFNFVHSQNILCTEEFCENYLKTSNKCPDIPDNCKIQNSTHNGLMLPYPSGPCNCCKFCLENLKRGEKCSIGTPSSNLPTNICGNGLGCESNLCETVDNVCTRAQKVFDDKKKKGEIGHLEVRPKCDRNGFYEPFFCIPGEICFCVDEKGNRIFGEMPFTSSEQIKEKCRCSREINSISKLVGKELHRDHHLRCTSDGSYDSIQCLDDKCLCVDNEDAAPTFPDEELVDLKDLSNNTMPCFDNKVHMTNEYYRPCESIYLEKRKEVLKLENAGYRVYGAVYPKCQLDGFYAPVQETSTHKFCVDPNGRLIGDYKVEIQDKSAENMDCKCARANLIIDNIERPKCSPNGNYEQVQCRRGLCRCVDSNGHQTVQEVESHEQNTLRCYKKP